MKTGTWRDICRPIIADVLSQQMSVEAQKKALFDAYPFGERARWPYKIWLDEIRRQKGTQTKPETAVNQMQMEF